MFFEIDTLRGVSVGLGRTMTANDVSAGVMIVLVLFAPARPAEFIPMRIQLRLAPS